MSIPHTEVILRYLYYVCPRPGSGGDENEADLQGCDGAGGGTQQEGGHGCLRSQDAQGGGTFYTLKGK